MAHVELSNPGNSRQQLGRMLAVDSRQVVVWLWFFSMNNLAWVFFLVING